MVILQATQNDASIRDPSVTITGRCASADDPFYDGFEFSFAVGFRPEMTGPAVSASVENFVLPTTVVALLLSWGCIYHCLEGLFHVFVQMVYSTFGTDMHHSSVKMCQSVTSVLYWLHH